MSKSKLFILLILLLCVFEGCLRYVPSRREIESSQSKEERANSSLKGPEEFLAFERKLEERRNRLVAERQGSVSALNEASYRLGAGDILELQVFGLPELTTITTVAPDGTASFPLVGPTRADGLTLAEFRETLTIFLKPYVRDPKVTLGIKEYGAHRVSVIGAVAKPGVYALRREGQTLIEVLSLAGGRTEKASSRIVLIPALGSTPAPIEAAQARAALSPNNGEGFGVEIDIDSLTGSVDKHPLVIPLRGGDTIVVPEVGTFKVDGEVIRAGSFPLASRTTALGAIAQSGGFTYSADVYQVEVIRELGDGKKASIVIDLEQVALNGSNDVLLRDGDIVRVPSDESRFNTRQVVEVLNGFFKAGVSGSVK